MWYWMLEPDTTCTSLPVQHLNRPAVHILFTGGPYFQNHFQIQPCARKHPNLKLRNSLGFPGASDGKESTCSAGDPDLIPGLEREGNGYPPQYSSWRIPWTEEPGVGATVHRASKSQTRLKTDNNWSNINSGTFSLTSHYFQP